MPTLPVQNLNDSSPTPSPEDEAALKKLPTPEQIQKDKQEFELAMQRSNEKFINKNLIIAPFTGAAKSLANIIAIGEEGNPAFDPYYGPNGPPLKPLQGPPVIPDSPIYQAQKLSDMIKGALPEQGVVGQMVEHFAQFAIPFSVLSKGVESVSLANTVLGRAGLMGLTNALTTDNHEKNLANLLVQFDNPLLNNTVMNFMAQREDDPALLAKMRQFVEGSALSVTADGLISLVKGAKALGMARMASKGEITLPPSEGFIDTEGAVVGKASTMPLSDVAKLPGQRSSTTTEAISDLADRIDTGEHVPQIHIQTKDGKPMTLMQGADDLRALQMLHARRADVGPVQPVEAQVNTFETGSLAGISANARKVDQAYNRSYEASKQEQTTLIQRIGKYLQGNKWSDASQDVKKGLIKQGGTPGQEAVKWLERTSGAPPRAQLIYLEQSKPIYDGLMENDERLLNNLIRSRTIVDIDKRRGLGAVRHEMGITGVEAADHIKQMELDLGSAKYNDLTRRADKFQEVIQGQLKELLDRKIITQSLFDTLKENFYSPTKFLHQLDPSEELIFQHGKVMSITNSGIPHLEGGATGAVEMNSRELLAEVVSRTQGRIARNEANRNLWEVARQYPDNGIVSLAQYKGTTKTGQARNVRIPSGMKKVSVFIDGKERPMVMEDKFATQWKTRMPQMTAAQSDLLRWALGGNVVRALATGYNPKFAITNIPVDIMHHWIASNEYSSQFPIFLAQRSMNGAATFLDALTRSGRFRDYIMEYGGMEFLSHQGRHALTPEVTNVLEQMDPHFRKLKEVAGWLGETSEIWGRLMLREQALKNGKTPLEATYIARKVADYSISGTYARTVDHLLPYTNARIQILKAAASNIKEHPLSFANKLAWMWGSTMAGYWYLYTNHHEMMRDMSDQNKMNNLIVPWGLSYRDAQGNVRHGFTKIKLDNTVAALTWPAHAAAIQYFEGRSPSVGLGQQIMNAAPINTFAPPVADAIMTYLSDYDHFTGSKPWSKTAPLSWPYSAQEYLGPGQTSHPLPQAMIDLAGFLGLSPTRLYASMGKIFPTNSYTATMAGGLDLLLYGFPPEERMKNTWELLSNNPMMLGLLSFTHPASAEVPHGQDVVERNLAQKLELDRKQDDMFYQYTQGGLTGGMATMRSWIRQAPPEEQKRLVNRLQSKVDIDRALKSFKGDPNVPGPGTWTYWSEQTPAVRAELFYDRWVAADSSERLKMQRAGERVGGFWSEDFARQFNKIKKERGVEQR